MNAIKKNVKTLTKTNKTVDDRDFAFCLKELIRTDDVLPALQNILTLVKTAMNDNCGLRHVTLGELKSTINTMNTVFDDGIGVEKSFITHMVGDSDDLSAMIISPFTNSELWIVQIHDTPGYLGDLGVHAINCACMHEDLEKETPYMNGVIIIRPIEDETVFHQVLCHEITHYLMAYIGKFIDRETIDRIDRIPNCEEFLADFLQFITFKKHFKDGWNDFVHYAEKHFDDRVMKIYTPFWDVILDMLFNIKSRYGTLE